VHQFSYLSENSTYSFPVLIGAGCPVEPGGLAVGILRILGRSSANLARASTIFPSFFSSYFQYYNVDPLRASGGAGLAIGVTGDLGRSRSTPVKMSRILACFLAILAVSQY
jgi:hypothetical protein